MAANNSAIWDWAFKIMSVLVIPLALWGIKLEVKSAVRDEKIVQLQIDVKEAADIETEVRQNAKTLARLEEKITAANNNLDTIKGLLRSP